MSAAAGALVGLGVGGGAVVALRRFPVLRRPALDARLAPYLRDTTPPSRLLAGREPERALVPALLVPPLESLARRLGAWLGGAGSVRSRLSRAGLDASVEQFRLQQVLWGGAGLLAAVALAALLAARGTAVPPLLALCASGGVGGVLARDRWLTEQAARRERRMLEELPTVADLLALAVTAGESVLPALERVAGRCGGELGAELARVLADARAGAPLAEALSGLASRTGLAPLARFAEGVVVAVERGTPLADVLRAQAADVREAGRRALLEAGGRKEIAMLVPVVFLVLPVTIVFALFPGFYGLSLSAP